VRAFFAALTTLTGMPIPRFQTKEGDLAQAANFFPVVGLLLGGVLFGIARLLEGIDLWVETVLLLLFSELLSRMLHLDGFADTCDALFSSRDRARKLEIMRDSRIGTMGVFGIVGLVLLKCALLHASPDRGIALLFAAAGGRMALPVYICTTQYARREGMGLIWYREKPVFGITLAVLFGGPSLFVLPHCWRAFLPVLAVFAVPLLWGALSKKIFGGATGDTIGFCEELTEIAVLGTALLAMTC